MEELNNTADKICKNKCIWQIILKKFGWLVKASESFLLCEVSKYKTVEQVYGSGKYIPNWEM